MLKTGLDLLLIFFKCLSFIIYPVISIIVLFVLLSGIWFLVYTIKGYKVQIGEVRPFRRKPLIYTLLVEVPKRFVLDKFSRLPDTFGEKGIHMFCGEQGSGKTISCVEYMLRLQYMYPKSKVITNFGLTTENDELNDWRQILDYTNEHKGVIVGIDEIQNWFQASKNQLPPEMLEIVTQNRKNRRVICCTAQVFTRVSKAIREQVTIVYQPHTFLGCFTIVVKRKPVFDSEGNVIDLKYRGMYSFVHTKEIREAFDTYKVIHTLSKEGFKEQTLIGANVSNNVYVTTTKKK